MHTFMDNAILSEMRRNGRPLDPCFTAEEELFIRFPADGEATPSHIRLPAQSLNRSKYSNTAWLLIPPYESNKIGVFKVGQIPRPEVSLGSVEYEFKIEHDPLDNNYAHSNLQTYKGGLPLREGAHINQAVKLNLRTAIFQEMSIIPNLH